MERRDFVRTVAGAGGLAVAGADSLAASPSTRTGEPFTLDYAPHFGMFQATAGDDLVDQLTFMHEQGFRSLEDNAHEDEERDGDQDLVGHEADIAVGERAEIGWVEDAEPHAHGAEHQRNAGQREGDGKAQHEEADDAEEHRAGENLAQKYWIHQWGLPSDS